MSLQTIRAQIVRRVCKFNSASFKQICVATPGASPADRTSMIDACVADGTLIVLGPSGIDHSTVYGLGPAMGNDKPAYARHSDVAPVPMPSRETPSAK